jgi:hypothetical protein
LKWRFRHTYVYMNFCVASFRNESPICSVFEALEHTFIFVTLRLLHSHGMFKYRPTANNMTLVILFAVYWILRRNFNTYFSRSDEIYRNLYEYLVSLNIVYVPLRSVAACLFGHLQPPSFVLNAEAADCSGTLLHIYLHLLNDNLLYIHCCEKIFNVRFLVIFSYKTLQ